MEAQPTTAQRPAPGSTAGSERRSRLGRPYRRVRRWARHTPNGEMAITLICVGTALIVLAAVLAVVI